VRFEVLYPSGGTTSFEKGSPDRGLAAHSRMLEMVVEVIASSASVVRKAVGGVREGGEDGESFVIFRGYRIVLLRCEIAEEDAVLVLVHVHPDGPDAATLQAFNDRSGVHQAASRHIYEHRPLLHLCNPVVVYQVVR